MPLRKTVRSWGPPILKDAAPGTIRKDFAQSIDRNAVHGSDSLENAKNEIEFFFKPSEIRQAPKMHSCCCC